MAATFPTNLSLSPVAMWVRRHSKQIFFGMVVLALAVAASYLCFKLMVPQKEDPDEGDYLMVARLLNAGHPYGDFSFDQFWMFPETLALAFRIFGDSLRVGRVTVVIFSLAGLLGMFLLARRLGGRWAAPLAILFGVIEPYYLAQSRIAVSDIPCVVCVIWAAVGMAEFCRRDQRLWLGLSGALVAAALVFKPLTVAFATALSAWLVVHRTEWRRGRPQVKLRDLIIDLGVFAVPGILIAAPFVNLADLPDEFRRTVFAHWLESQHNAPGFLQRLQGLLKFLSRAFMWLPFAVAGVLRGMRRAPGLTVALAAGELFSAGLLVQFPPWDNHYTLLSPILIVFAVVGIDEGMVMLRQKLRLAGQLRRESPMSYAPNRFAETYFPWAVAVWLLSLPWLTYTNLRVFNEPVNDLAMVTSYLKRNTAPGSYLLTDNAIIVYSADRLMPPLAMNLPFEGTFDLHTNAHDELERVISRSPVTAIVLTSDYAQNPELISWIKERFPFSKLLPGDSLETTARVFTQTGQGM